MTLGSQKSHSYQKIISKLFILALLQHLWGLRERLAEALLHDGYCFKYDVSLPLDCFYDLVEIMRERLKGVATRVIGYGHVGDGKF